jgi:chromosome partitioning protein
MNNKILTIAHTKGGVGKSTILINTVIDLQKRGHNVWVLDLDPNRVASAISSIRLNKKLKTYDVTQITALHQLDNISKQEFDGIIVIDTAGVDNKLTRKAIELATLTIVPVAPSITEVVGFRTFEKVMKVINVDPKNIKVLINQRHPRATKFENFKYQLGKSFEYMDTTLPRLGDFVNSLASGHGVIEIKKKKDNKEIICRAGKEIETLTTEIIEKLGV